MWKIEYSSNDEDDRFNLNEHSDKAILPEYILEQIINNGPDERLPHPLIFKLNSINASCFIGVKEFNPNNTMILPGDIKRKLGVSDESMLQLELTTVENAEDAFIEIKPRSKIGDQWKAILEARLPQFYTVVSSGDILYLPVGNKEYVVDVAKVKGRSVCVVDKDIDLLIDESNLKEDKCNDNGHERWPIVMEWNEVNEENIHKGVKLDQGLKIKFDVKRGESIISNGDFIIGDQFNQFEWCSVMARVNKRGEKKWVATEDQSVFIYSLVPLHMKLQNDSDGNDNADEDRKNIPTDQVQCQYCGSFINMGAQVMHESFCRRNNIKCERGCERTFLNEIPDTHWHCCDQWGDDSISLNIHEYYLHDNGISECPECHMGIKSTNYSLGLHRGLECPQAMHICQYCHLSLLRGEPTYEAKYHNMTGHEWQCGSKTIACDQCHKSIRLRDINVHMALHDEARRNQKEPLICSNPLCIKMRSMENNNELGLCDVCFGPLYSNVNDPLGKLLRSKIERRYIIQLKNGCKRMGCDNELCFTSDNHLKFNNMSEIVKYVKEVLMNRIYECSFCVDESTEIKKRIVEILDNKKWSYRWRCKGVNECGIDLDKVEKWLELNAPSLLN